MIGGLIAAGICALVSFSIDILNGDPVHFAIALGLAVAPVPLLLALVLALDRLEPEPRAQLIFAFAWGAGVAVLFAGLLNTFNLILVTRHIGDAEDARALVATFGAPPVEETLKGLVLLGLLRFRRQELDGPTDGIMYASMVGLGFAMSENVGYYLAQLTHGQPEALAATVAVRGILSPLAHPLFTSLIGMSVAYAALHRGARGYAAIAAGWAGAMVLHGVWNGFASSFGLGGLAIAYVLLMILLVIEIIVIFADRRRMVGLLQYYLPPYERIGVIGQADIAMLSSLQRRRDARAWARLHGGRAAARAMSDFQVAATELGLLHARAARGAIDEASFHAQQRSLIEAMAHARAALPAPGRSGGMWGGSGPAFGVPSGSPPGRPPHTGASGGGFAPPAGGPPGPAPGGPPYPGHAPGAASGWSAGAPPGHGPGQPPNPHRPQPGSPHQPPAQWNPPGPPPGNPPGDPGGWRNPGGSPGVPPQGGYGGPGWTPPGR